MHATLVGLIVHSLGARHAALLARPVDRGDGRVDWYTGLPGQIVGPFDIAPAALAGLRQKAEELLADLRRLQSRLNTEGPASRATARLLSQVIDVDLDTGLHAVGGEPVLAPWGAAPRPATAPIGITASLFPDASNAPTSPPISVTRRTASRTLPHAAGSLLLLLVGGSALAAALLTRPTANPALTARIDALKRGNAELGQAMDRLKSGKCKPIR
ncbi:MAG: hypothetical protein L6Q68_08860 [Aquabacterium sp.]|nr:hypothetical protein [Aquabacterium sp.]